MGVGGNTWFKKQTSIHFKIKNISPIKKKLNILGVSIFYGQTLDLLNYPTISEADIRESLIKGELAHKIRVGDIIIASNSMELLQFDEEQKQFIINAGGTIGIDPNRIAKDSGQPYLELGPLGESVPANSYFFDVDGTPSYTDGSGDPHVLGSGGGGASSAELNGNYLRTLGVIVATTDTITLNQAKWQAVYHYDVSITLSIELPSSPVVNDIVYVYLNTGVNSTRVFGNGIDIGWTGKEIRNFIYTADGWSYNIEIDEDEWIKSVNANSIQQSLNLIKDTVKFNYQRLNSVGHPIPAYNHGVGTVGWNRSQFLRSLNIITSVDVAEDDSGEIITLTAARWQGVVNINKNNVLNVVFPVDGVNDGDIIHIYVENGGTCTVAIWNGSTEYFLSNDQNAEFKYNASADNPNAAWVGTNQSNDYWIKSVNKNTIENSGIGNIFFEDAAILSGTYYGDVVCINATNIVGNVEITGSFYSYGDVINAGGYSVLTFGNFFARNVDFDPGEGVVFQNDFEVNGDLICQEILFSVNRFTGEGESSYPNLAVRGDLLIYGGNIDAPGNDGAPGLNISVVGDLYCNENIYLSGGDSTINFDAAGGGNLDVAGDALFYHLESYGGDTINTNFAGNGGSITIRRDCVGSIYLDGGDANDNGDGTTVLNNSGNGGSLTVGGNYYSLAFSSTGGLCASSSGSHAASYGGEVIINENLFVNEDATIATDGGVRTGILTESGNNDSANGGSITVSGSIIGQNYQISTTGGAIETGGFSPSLSAGIGGSITVNCDFIHSNVSTSGGGNYNTAGGSGGDITVYGNLLGNGEYGIFCNGGNGAMTNDSSANGSGGSAANISVQGNISTYIDGHGGDGWNDFGGSAGNITCSGTIRVDGINLVGGNCVSTNEVHTAASGGTIYCHDGIQCNGSLSLNGGDRGGTTTTMSQNNPANGGNITITNGNLTTGDCTLDAGEITTTYNSGNGGSGGNLILTHGDIYVSGTLSSRGGDSAGGPGGPGGFISCYGKSIIGTVILVGGESTVAVGNSDQGLSGCGGAIITAGCIIQNIQILDSSVGMGTTTDQMGLALSGDCYFGNINLSDRIGSLIIPASPGSVATLVIREMTNKKTLNNVDYSETLDISANLDTSIFKTNGTNWYILTGTLINSPG